MKFVCTRDNLLGGLTQVVPLAGRNVQLPVLAHVLCRAENGVLELLATDLEVGARKSVPGKVEEEGGCTVVARTFLDYVQQLPSSHPVELKLEERGLRVKTEGFEALFPVGTVEEFPLLPGRGQQAALEIEGERLAEAVTGVIFAAAKDITRPEIHSVLWVGEKKELRLAATDSFRLREEVWELAKEVSKDFSFLLPLSAAQEVARLLAGMKEKVVIYPQESHVTFEARGLEFTSRLVEGKYPDYRQIIPTKHVVEGEVERADFLRALKTLIVFLPRDSRRVTCRISPEAGELVMQIAASQGEGKVRVPFKGEGKEVEVLFNIQYLLEGAQHLKGSVCLIGCGGSSEPTLLLPSEKGKAGRSVYVVMPIQA
jgi:DNA polymerase-3 subunit beta